MLESLLSLTFSCLNLSEQLANKREDSVASFIIDIWLFNNWSLAVHSSKVLVSLLFLFFGIIKHIGKIAATRHVTDSITIGSTPGSSAINGDSIVANLANKLQFQKNNLLEALQNTVLPKKNDYQLMFCGKMGPWMIQNWS